VSLPRNSRNEESPHDEQKLAPLPLLTTAETLRSAASSAVAAKEEKGEEKISLFWRVFGGTILSIASVVAITVYQSLASAIHEVRSEVTKLNEAKAEFTRKEEFTSSRTKMWERVQQAQATADVGAGLKERVTQLEADRKELQAGQSGDRKEFQALQGAVAALKERLTNFDTLAKQIEQNQKELQTVGTSVAAMQAKALERDASLAAAREERKKGDLAVEASVAGLKERVVTLEQGLKPVEPLHKEFQTLAATVRSMSEKCATRDQEVKALRDERKELEKELLSLRERLAKFEGAYETKPAGRSGGTIRPASATKPVPPPPAKNDSEE
jgi:DNA repair exonuclease SbcCD ATPase subunit